MIRYGPAGWSYKDWAGEVYPQPKPKGFDPLTYLSGYFDAIEVNSTFYHPASERTARSWARRVSENPDFLFTAKLWKRFTHERERAWTEDEVAQARAGMDPLMEASRLGAVLIQFPWSFRNTEENREWLDDVIGTFSDFPMVLEVRHSSWNVPEFYRSLAERSVGFVNIDQPLFHDSIKPSAKATAPVEYIRVHGRNYHDWFRKDAEPYERYNYLYPPEELRPWAERAKELAAAPGTENVFVVTNNHYKGKGVVNALMLESMVEEKDVAAPETVFRSYAGVLEGFAHPAPPAAA